MAKKLKDLTNEKLVIMLENYLKQFNGDQITKEMLKVAIDRIIKLDDEIDSIYWEMAGEDA